MAKEIEIKFRISSPHRIRRRLKELGAESHGKSFEDNLLFDTKEGRLRKRDEMLRVRTAGGKKTLTFKGGRDKKGRLKSREEIETLIEDEPEKLVKLFEGIGFAVAGRYQKERETWSYKGAEVLIDRTPMGWFVEIEGSPGAIRKVAAGLGLDMDKGTAADYLELWRSYAEKHRKDKKMMLMP